MADAIPCLKTLKSLNTTLEELISKLRIPAIDFSKETRTSWTEMLRTVSLRAIMTRQHYLVHHWNLVYKKWTQWRTHDGTIANAGVALGLTGDRTTTRQSRKPSDTQYRDTDSSTTMYYSVRRHNANRWCIWHILSLSETHSPTNGKRDVQTYEPVLVLATYGQQGLHNRLAMSIMRVKPCTEKKSSEIKAVLIAELLEFFLTDILRPLSNANDINLFVPLITDI